MFFTKKKKDVIGIFKDKKNYTYELVRINNKDKQTQKEEIGLYRGKEIIPSWSIDCLKLDLLKSSREEIDLLVTKCLQTSANIQRCLYKMEFPQDSIMDILNGIHKDKDSLRQAVLVYQPVIEIPGFIESLPEREQWLLLTQNNYRTVENMKNYLSMYQKIVANVLNKYLATKYMEKYSEINGGWKHCMEQTFKVYYAEENDNPIKYIQQSIEMALRMNEEECNQKKDTLTEIKSSIKELDKKYEDAPLSEKFKIENKIKELIVQEETALSEIKELEEKGERITSYFEQ